MGGRKKNGKLSWEPVPPMGLMRPRSKEWNWAWRELKDITGDADFVARNPRSGEAWQYMGSVKRPWGWEHEFRHRDHPATNERMLVRIRASAPWLPHAMV